MESRIEALSALESAFCIGFLRTSAHPMTIVIESKERHFYDKRDNRPHCVVIKAFTCV